MQTNSREQGMLHHSKVLNRKELFHSFQPLLMLLQVHAVDGSWWYIYQLDVWIAMCKSFFILFIAKRLRVEDLKCSFNFYAIFFFYHQSFCSCSYLFLSGNKCLELLRHGWIQWFTHICSLLIFIFRIFAFYRYSLEENVGKRTIRVNLNKHILTTRTTH